jgi:anti-sigma regulatory factor (Ser/Thr protein kinase)
LTARRAVPADASQLAELNRFLAEFWRAAELEPAWLGSFELALEEIFLNVVMHGSGPGGAPRVEVSLSLGTDAVTMTVEDDGPHFDPLSLPPPDLTAGLADRRVGGLGVHLVRNLMDTVSYARAAGRNQLCMSKRGQPRAARGKSA